MVGSNDKAPYLRRTGTIISTDWSDRAITHGKRGSIPDDLLSILSRLKINLDNYVRFITPLANVALNLAEPVIADMVRSQNFANTYSHFS